MMEGIRGPLASKISEPCFDGLLSSSSRSDHGPPKSDFCSFHFLALILLCMLVYDFSPCHSFMSNLLRLVSLFCGISFLCWWATRILSQCLLNGLCARCRLQVSLSMMDLIWSTLSRI